MSFLDEKFSDEYDDNPKLKGKQKDLPDALQKAIIDDDLEEGKVKNFLTGLALFTALMAGKNAVVNSDPGLKKLKAAYEQAEKKDDAEKMKELKDKITKQKIWLEAGEGEPQSVDETKTVELPADTTFTLDLKHLMKKHMDEGKSQEDVVKLTKKLMAKLHDKGEVKVDGTKVIFRENSSWGGRKPKDPRTDIPWGGQEPKDPRTDIPWGGQKPKDPRADIPWGGKDPVHPDDEDKTNEQEDTQLALPEPDAQDFLGDDGMDYEGGMAKSQMLKMKNYAKALCDMIDDESQLESWVQAKLTKASDYMSSVYHYLDYQRSKMNENKATSRDIEDEIKTAFRSQGDLDTFLDDLTDEDEKEFLDLMNSDLKGNAYEKALGRLIDRYKG
jgi:hypothetical protein